MLRALASVKDALSNLRRAPSMALAVVVVSAVSLTLFGVALLINSQVSLVKGFWYDKVEVSVFLSEEVTSAEKENLEQAFKSDPLIDVFYYESKQQAYQLFKEQFRNSPELIGEVTVSQMPESFRVSLIDPENFSEISQSYSYYPGVDVVQDQQAVLEGFFSVLSGAQKTAVVLALIQVGTALVLIFNTIRMAAISRRRETKIMRLVGAPRIMIAFPFILEGVIAGLAGALLSVISLVGIKLYLVDNYFASSSQSFPLIGWSDVMQASILVLVLSFFVSASASAVSIFRHLKV